MNLAKESAVLSAMAYDTSFTSSGFQDFESFTDEPDQALFVKKTVGGNDYCFGVFRGTTMKWVDWKQNFDPKSQEVCVAVGGHEQCCVTRNGFFDAYSTSYASKLEERLRECAKTCTNKDECVVLTGHSQVRESNSSCAEDQAQHESFLSFFHCLLYIYNKLPS